MAQDFHTTRRGSKYYDFDIPKIADQLERIANALEAKNKLEEKKLVLEQKKLIKESREVSSGDFRDNAEDFSSK